MAKKTVKRTLNQRVKSNPELLRRALADPGLRSRLESKYLSRKQQNKRKLNTRLRAPLVPGSDTTYRDFARERNAQEKLNFGPQYQEIKNAGYNLRDQTKRDTAYFDEYRDVVRKAQENQNAANAQANQAAAGVATSVQQTGQQGIEAEVAAKKAEAAKTGGPFDEAAYRQLAGNAANQRNSQAQTQVAQSAGQGVGQSALLGGLTVAGQEAKRARLIQIAQAKTKLQEEKAQLTAKKGDWRTAFFTDAKNEARKGVLENKLYGVKAATAAADINLEQQKQDSSDLTVNQWGYTKSEWAALPTSERSSIKKADAN